MNPVKHFLKKVYLFSFNNIAFNKLMIALNKEHWARKFQANSWAKFKHDPKRSLQENAGFSHRKDIEKALQMTHDDLAGVRKEHLQAGDAVLDIGCGPGLYLQDFGTDFDLTGTDISKGMLDLAKIELPAVDFRHGDFLSLDFQKKFHLIYSISVMEYIARRDIARFFEKLAGHCAEGGLIFIQYPHALRSRDLYYPNLSYIRYSPALIEKLASEHFDILRHDHSYDRRKVDAYDQKRYASGTTMSYLDGYQLIAKKRP